MKESIETKLAQTASRLGVGKERLPHHIAIIMDGNGRWAERRGLPRYEGHSQGGKTVERIVQYCVDIGMESLTLYSFSMQNWKRPKAEVDFLMHLYTQYLVEIRPLLMQNDVRLVHIGKLERLPDSLVREMHKTVKMTENNGGMVLGLALNYGSRTEITDAVAKIAKECLDGRLKPEQIDEECVANHLYTAGLADPDILIRTSNEMRISNFLLWQLSYTEFYVTRQLWPDFDKADIDEAILAYSNRNRRFGGLKAEAKNI